MFETVEEIQPSSPKFAAAIELLRQLYPERSPERLHEELSVMLAQQGWRLVGVFDGGECAATMLVHVGHRLYSGKFIRMDSMVIDETRRSRGLGKVLMRWAIREGKKIGAKTLMLDSYSDNHAAHRFFHREGAQISGFHFTYALDQRDDED